MVEMGISEFGEMENLVRFVEPDVAVVTNIGEAHIAHLGKKRIQERKTKNCYEFYREAACFPEW